MAHNKAGHSVDACQQKSKPASSCLLTRMQCSPFDLLVGAINGCTWLGQSAMDSDVMQGAALVKSSMLTAKLAELHPFMPGHGLGISFNLELEWPGLQI